MPTALMLELSTTDGTASQHMVVYPSRDLFRRSISPTNRSQWRHAQVADTGQWVQGNVSLAATATPTPMTLRTGCVLIEVTEEEATKAEGTTWAEDVNTRFNAVLDSVHSDASYVPTESDKVKEFVDQWLDAVSSGDTDWLDRHTHPAGRISAPAPAPAASTPEPAPAPVPDPNPHGWVYPANVGGYITRPNGQRYKVRDLHGKSDVDRLRAARLRGEHVFLSGDPGTGKTAMVEAAFGTELVTLIGTEDTEASDFRGTYLPRGKGYAWADGAMTSAMERGVPLFVYEGGVIATKAWTTAYPVMDGRSELLLSENPDRPLVVAQPGFIVIMATNPDAPGVRLSEALVSRFDLSIEVGTDYDMMVELGVPTELVTAAKNLNTRKVNGERVWVPQARELLRASEQLVAYGADIALRNLIASCPDKGMRADVIEALHRVYGGTRMRWLTL